MLYFWLSWMILPIIIPNSPGSGEYELTLDGIHENFLRLSYHDPLMQKTVSTLKYVFSLPILLWFFLFFNIYASHAGNLLYILLKGQMSWYTWNFWITASVCFPNSTNVTPRSECTLVVINKTYSFFKHLTNDCQLYQPINLHLWSLWATSYRKLGSQILNGPRIYRGSFPLLYSRCTVIILEYCY